MLSDAFNTAEKLLTINEASDLLPRKNGKKTPSLTIKRWIVKGYRGVRLRGTKVGNQWFTSADAVAEFQAACTAKAMGQAVGLTVESRHNADAALAYLKTQGFFDRERGNGTDDKEGGSRRRSNGSNLHGVRTSRPIGAG